MIIKLEYINTENTLSNPFIKCISGEQKSKFTNIVFKE